MASKRSLAENVLMSDSESESDAGASQISTKRRKEGSPGSAPTKDKKCEIALNTIQQALLSMEELVGMAGMSKDHKKRAKAFIKKIRKNTDVLEGLLYGQKEWTGFTSVLSDISKSIKDTNDRIDKLQQVQEKTNEDNVVRQNKLQHTFAQVAASSSREKPKDVVKVAGLKKPVQAVETFKVQVEGVPDGRRVALKGNALKNHIMSNIRPNEVGFKPAKIFVNKDDKVIIEAHDRNIQKLAGEANLADQLSVKITNIGKIRPRLTIFNVPAEIDEKNLAKLITEQNDITSSHIKPIYKFGPRGRHFVHWVVEVDPDTRRDILRKRTLYINWHSCNVEDKIHLTKCYNCQGFGHTAPKCNQPVACGNCAEGHDTRQCPNKDDNTKIKCTLCSKAKIEDNKHKPRDGKCFIFKRRMEAFVANIDFGSEDTPMDY